MEITRKSDQEVLQVADILAYRANKDGDKPFTWHKNDDDESVASKFGISYKQLTDLRNSDDFKTFAKQWAEDNGVDAKVLLGKRKGGKRGGITKANYESIGKKVVDAIVSKVEPLETDDEEHHTTTEWANNQVDGMLDTLDDFEPASRPVKPKKAQSVAAKERQAAIDKLREQGVSDEVIANVYGEDDIPF